MMGAGIGAPNGTGRTSGSLVSAGGAAGTLSSFPIWISRGGPGTGGLLSLTRSRRGNDRSCLWENPVIGDGEEAFSWANAGSAAINNRRNQQQDTLFLIRSTLSGHTPPAREIFHAGAGYFLPLLSYWTSEGTYVRNDRSSTAKCGPAAV